MLLSGPLGCRYRSRRLSSRADDPVHHRTGRVDLVASNRRRIWILRDSGLKALYMRRRRLLDYPLLRLAAPESVLDYF